MAENFIEGIQSLAMKIVIDEPRKSQQDAGLQHDEQCRQPNANTQLLHGLFADAKADTANGLDEFVLEILVDFAPQA